MSSLFRVGTGLLVVLSLLSLVHAQTCLSGQNCVDNTCFTAAYSTMTIDCGCYCADGSLTPTYGTTSCEDCNRRCDASSCTVGSSCSSSTVVTAAVDTGAVCVSTNSTVAGSPIDPTAWLGTWEATGCDPDKCCCASILTISDSGAGTYTVTGTGLSSGCGTNKAIDATISVPTTDVLQWRLIGESHTSYLADTIRDVNNDQPACSAGLTKTSKSAATTSAPRAEAWLLIGAAVALQLASKAMQM